MVTSDKQNNSVKEKPLTTYERLMKDSEFKKEFEIGYQQFAASEIMLQLMEEKPRQKNLWVNFGSGKSPSV